MAQVNDDRQDLLAEAISPPEPHFASSMVAVDVKIIDSTSRLSGPMSMIVDSPYDGHDSLDCPSFSFLIQHPSGRKVLFDLGTRKDWENLPPALLKIFQDHSLDAKVEKNVSEILEEYGYKVSEGAFEAVIFSHWHYDHIGDMSTFPSTTSLVVGPGFKEAFIPGYPARQDGLLRQSDYEGRDVREITFDGNIDVRIGGYLAKDYFGDGSFYLLDTPGHAIGHLCGLARVRLGPQKHDNTFVFMGGDVCHHGGEFRPTKFLPLPKTIELSQYHSWPRGVCPGEVMQKVHHRKSACVPFYEIANDFPFNRAELESTIQKMQVLDAVDNVFVVIAHDQTLLDIGMDMFPKSINDWLSKGYGEKGRWGFVNDFAKAADMFLAK